MSANSDVEVQNRVWLVLTFGEQRQYAGSLGCRRS